MDVADIVGVAGSAAGGGLFGLIGTGLGRITGYFETKQKLMHEKDRWRHDEALRQLEMQAQREIAADNRAMAETKGSWDGMKASHAAEAAIGSSYRWVDAVRGLTRPCLTFALWAITLLIFLNASPSERQGLINSVLFAATAATLWWFGDRAPRHHGSEGAVVPVEQPATGKGRK